MFRYIINKIFVSPFIRVIIFEEWQKYVIKFFKLSVCELDYSVYSFEDSFETIQKRMDYAISLKDYLKIKNFIKGDCVYIKQLYTNTVFRKMGYGRKIINIFINDMEKKGYNFFFLMPYSWEENISQKNLVKFYKSCNFELLNEGDFTLMFKTKKNDFSY